MTPLPLLLLGVIISLGVGQKCPDAKVKLSQFHKWTETVKEAGKVRPVADAPCWFDLTRSDCGRCKDGGKQCGTPMQEWCQSPRNKGGCQGIPSARYTLSTTGAPCFWDPLSKDCAWCVKKDDKQCSPSEFSEKCDRNKKCDGNRFDCRAGRKCGTGAKCHPKRGRCVCGEGLIGNGQQCFDGDCTAGNCTLVTMAGDETDLSIETFSQYFVIPMDSAHEEL